MTGKQKSERTKRVVVIGAGGNIGSHLVPHLARMNNVAEVTLIDRDVYEAANLSTQDITAQDVGRSKALVQARRLLRINPDLRVHGIAEAVERVPLGQLRADVILACLDTRRARAYVNRVAWRLGVPWIDTGVEGTALLARVNVYVPAAEGACLECAWDERDYQMLEQSYPCREFAEESFRTNAPSSLGALAGSLQAIECSKVLRGQWEKAAVGQQVLVAALDHKHYVTSYRRNPECRMDHERWSITKLGRDPRGINVGQALMLAKRSNGDCSVGLRMEGSPFVSRLTCIGCGETKPLLRLQDRLRPGAQNCAGCGGRMMAAGRDLNERLEADALPRKVENRSLHSLGFRPGDLFSVGNRRGELHFELDGDER